MRWAQEQEPCAPLAFARRASPTRLLHGALPLGRPEAGDVQGSLVLWRDLPRGAVGKPWPRSVITTFGWLPFGKRRAKTPGNFSTKVTAPSGASPGEPSGNASTWSFPWTNTGVQYTRAVSQVGCGRFATGLWHLRLALDAAVGVVGLHHGGFGAGAGGTPDRPYKFTPRNLQASSTTLPCL